MPFRVASSVAEIFFSAGGDATFTSTRWLVLQEKTTPTDRRRRLRPLFSPQIVPWSTSGDQKGRPEAWEGARGQRLIVGGGLGRNRATAARLRAVCPEILLFFGAAVFWPFAATHLLGRL